MLKIHSPIDNEQDAITRSVALHVVEELLQATHLSPDEIEFKGELGTSLLTGSALGDEDSRAKFTNSRKLTLEASETYHEDSINTEGGYSSDGVPVLYDRLTNAKIVPRFSLQELTLHITYRGQSGTEIETWRQRIRYNLERNFQSFHHTVRYRYAIPSISLRIAEAVHARLLSDDNYTDTFSQYLKKMFAARVILATDLAGGKPTFMVDEGQSGIQGQWDFITPPKKERSGEHSNEITLAYTLRYPKPAMLVTIFPEFVRNQRMPKELRPVVPATNYIVLRDNIRRDYDEVIQSTVLKRSRTGGIRVPNFNPFEVIVPPKDLSPVMDILIAINKDDPAKVMNFADLSHYKLNPDVYAYILACGEDIFNYHRSAIHIALHSDDPNPSPIPITLDNDGTIRTSMPLDVKYLYNLRISLLNNWTTLIQENKVTPTTVQANLIYSHPEATRIMLHTLEPSLYTDLLIDFTNEDGNIRKGILPEAIMRIKTTNKDYTSCGFVDRARVGFMLIDVLRED